VIADKYNTENYQKVLYFLTYMLV